MIDYYEIKSQLITSVMVLDITVKVYHRFSSKFTT